MVGAQRTNSVGVAGAAGCDDGEAVQLCDLDGVVAYAGCGADDKLEAQGVEGGGYGGYSQLPPQTSTAALEPRSMPRQSFEKKASHAVVAARGTVDACSSVVPSGTWKEMSSSARVYWL